MKKYTESQYNELYDKILNLIPKGHAGLWNNRYSHIEHTDMEGDGTYGLWLDCNGFMEPNNLNDKSDGNYEFMEKFMYAYESGEASIENWIEKIDNEYEKAMED